MMESAWLEIESRTAGDRNEDDGDLMRIAGCLPLPLRASSGELVMAVLIKEGE